MARRHPVQREKDLTDIAHRYLNLHQTQPEIAAALQVCQATISNDLKLLVDRWTKSGLMDLNRAKAQELERINHLELVYWDAWEVSKQDKESTLAEKTEGNEIRTKAQQRKEGQVGSPSFLAGVQWCIDRRCKLLGLDAPTKIAPTDPSGTKEYDNLTDEQRLAKLAIILDTARERRDGETGGGDDSGGELEAVPPGGSG